jgi:hypothetical protein
LDSPAASAIARFGKPARSRISEVEAVLDRRDQRLGQPFSLELQ